MSSEVTEKPGYLVVPGDRVATRQGDRWFLVLNTSEDQVIDGTGNRGRLAYNHWGERMVLRRHNTYRVMEAKLS